ncbi:MAG: substrate-binding domain-containing protein [Candidatus Eremiobacteraeota bacterium]|nr:substrate-binding domain-containing protein [Candidatus Eremiobacteraeota bacterium]
MFKRHSTSICVILAVFFILVLTSCQPQKGNVTDPKKSTSDPTSKQGKVKVAMIYSFDSPQTLKNRISDFALSNADVAIIDIYLGKEGGMGSGRIIHQLVDIGIDAICLVDLPPEQMEECINVTKSVNVPVFVISRTSIQKNSTYTLVVDYSNLAKAVEDYLAKKLGKGAKVLVIHDEVPLNQKMAKNFKKIVKKDKKLNLVAVCEIKAGEKLSLDPGRMLSINKEKRMLYKKIGSILKKYRDVKGIVVMSEVAQLDVYKVLDELNMKDVSMVSFGDELMTIPFIIKGGILKANVEADWGGVAQQLFSVIKKNAHAGKIPQKNVAGVVIKDIKFYQKRPMVSPQEGMNQGGSNSMPPPGSNTQMLPPLTTPVEGKPFEKMPGGKGKQFEKMPGGEGKPFEKMPGGEGKQFKKMPGGEGKQFEKLPEIKGKPLEKKPGGEGKPLEKLPEIKGKPLEKKPDGKVQ